MLIVSSVVLAELILKKELFEFVLHHIVALVDSQSVAHPLAQVLVDVLGLVTLVNQKDRGVVRVVSNAPPNNLVDFADGGDFVPVVAHDSGRWQLETLLGKRASLNLIIPFEAVIQVCLLKVDPRIVDQQVRNSYDQTSSGHGILKVKAFRELSSTDAHKDALAVVVDVLLVCFVVSHGHVCVLILNEDLRLAEIKLRLLKLLIAVGDVRVGREEHQDATVDVLVKPVHQFAQVLVALIQVFIVKVELELVPLVVSGHDRREHLRFTYKVLSYKLHAKL